MPEPRRTFAPVLALGLAAGILAAVAGSRPWVVDSEPDGPTPDPLGTIADAGEMPLGLALALVVLACWGVILVTRGVMRRVVAVMALLAAAGLVATVVVAFFTLPDQVSHAIRAVSPSLDDVFGSELSAWYFAAALGAIGSLVATAAAVRWVGHWPEMGSRYDAPGRAGEDRTDEAGEEDRSSLDLWKSIDEGRDPTV